VENHSLLLLFFKAPEEPFQIKQVAYILQSCSNNREVLFAFLKERCGPESHTDTCNCIMA